MEQQKTIVIVDLKPVSGMKKDGSGTWTKFNIKGNDGITYQTWDQPWFLQRKIGETINITFYTTTFQGQRGLVTNYNIVIDPQAQQTPIQYNQQPMTQMPSRVNPGVNMNVTAIIAEIKRAEINIIAAIRTHCGTNINGVEKKQSLSEQIPVIQENGTGEYTVKEEVEETEELGDSNPF